jgi:hypothetical protein
VGGVIPDDSAFLWFFGFAHESIGAGEGGYEFPTYCR